MNVMKLAWKIFKSDLGYTFSYSLKLAWKICKVSIVKIEEEIFKIKSKFLSRFEYYCGVQRESNTICIYDSPYNLRTLFYEVNSCFE